MAVSFSDVAASAGLTHPSIYGGLDRKRFIIETNGSGVAWLDADEDGWLDALVLSGTRLRAGARENEPFVSQGRGPTPASAGAAPTNRLYRNNRNGTFTDITERAGLRRTGWSSGVCVGDYDADGHLDLHVTEFGQNVLYRHRGDGRYEDTTRRAGLPVGGVRWGSGCSFLDYDRDGRLDLFVANYLAFDLAGAAEPGTGPNCLWKGVPVNCGPKGLPTDTNLLYRNNGDGTFTDVSKPSGVAAVTGRYPMTAAAADFDGDGWIDIYVASDSTAAILYRNKRDGTFADEAVTSGAGYSENGDPQAGMGLAIGDFNLDGLLDILKTHFADDIPALYRNLGHGLFEDVAMATGLGVQNRHVEWGAGFPDLDNDGRPDIFYATGNVYPEVERRLPEYPHRGPRIIFRNMSQGRGLAPAWGAAFRDVSRESGQGAADARSSRGAAFGDYDNDGDLDVLIMNMNEAPSLLRNDLPQGPGWLQIRLEGTRSNRHGVGATVIVFTAGGRRQAQAALSQSSYYSVDDLRLHFGLGAADAAERVEVRWPSGQVDVLNNVMGRRLVTIIEGRPTPPSSRNPRPRS